MMGFFISETLEKRTFKREILEKIEIQRRMLQLW